MAFSITKTDLDYALTLLKGSIEPSKSHPILEHIVFDATGDAVTLRATNLFREAEVVIEADVKAEGQAALPSPVLYEVVRRLSDEGVLNFKKDGAIVVLSCGRSRYRVPFLPSEKSPSYNHCWMIWNWRGGVGPATIAYAPCYNRKALALSEV